MSKEDWNLGDKREPNRELGFSRWIYDENDVKEFIARLKEELTNSKKTFEELLGKDYPCFSWNILEKIDTLSGEKLTK